MSANVIYVIRENLIVALRYAAKSNVYVELI